MSQPTSQPPHGDRDRRPTPGPVARRPNPGPVDQRPTPGPVDRPPAPAADQRATIPSRRPNRLLILAVALAVLVGAVVVGLVLAHTGTDKHGRPGPTPGGDLNATAGPNPEDPMAGSATNTTDMKDARVTSCDVDRATGFVAAGVTVDNSLSKRSNFEVALSFVDKTSGAAIDSGLVSFAELNPGRSATKRSVGTRPARPNSFTCQLTNVTTFASGD